MAKYSTPFDCERNCKPTPAIQCKISLGVPVGRYYIQSGYQYMIIIEHHMCRTLYHYYLHIHSAFKLLCL